MKVFLKFLSTGLLVSALFVGCVPEGQEDPVPVKPTTPSETPLESSTPSATAQEQNAQVELSPGRVTKTGHFISSFETSSFQPCGSEDRWWVSGAGFTTVNDFLLKQKKPAHGGPGQNQLMDGAVLVTFTGTISELGHHGHLGAYQRQFTVNEATEISLWSSGGCP